jgi:beta-glucosidase
LHAHLVAAAHALREGVPLRGYFIRSLMDNFEWGHGYTQRFGLVYIDYATQPRLWKDNAHWYQQFLRGPQAPDARQAESE